MVLQVIFSLLNYVLQNVVDVKTCCHPRLDSDTDISKQLREDAEMTMQELTSLAQHTSVSLILVLDLFLILIICCYVL